MHPHIATQTTTTTTTARQAFCVAMITSWTEHDDAGNAGASFVHIANALARLSVYGVAQTRRHSPQIVDVRECARNAFSFPYAIRKSWPHVLHVSNAMR